jgi:predicted phage terminase large subunit-like protein
MFQPVAFEKLPEDTKAEIWETQLSPPTNEFIPHSLTTDNQNEKQQTFLLLKEREVFYGGAAGGAKTSGILAAALQYVDLPNYHALLLRRSFKQLSMPGNWIPMSHEWLSTTRAHWVAGDKQWRFPSGATLTFGFVGNLRDDVEKYRTAAFNFLGIDELTAWNESDYVYLFSRLRRRSGTTIPSRMRSASNPGGRGHEWVKRRFVDPLTRHKTAVYLPARLTDNPYLDQSDYIKSLREQHPTNWRRLLYGDWDIADPGEMFQPREWLQPEHFLEEAPGNVEQRVRYWDLAASEITNANPDPDWTVGFKMSRIKDGTKAAYVMEHVVRVRKTAGHVERLVAQTALSDPEHTEVWMEQEPGASGKSMIDHYRRDVMPEGIRIRGLPARTAKSERARPWAAAMENGRLRIVRGPWNEALFDELEAFSEDTATSGAHDDQVDAGSGAFERLRRVSGPASMQLVPGGPIRR